MLWQALNRISRSRSILASFVKRINPSSPISSSVLLGCEVPVGYFLSFNRADRPWFVARLVKRKILGSEYLAEHPKAEAMLQQQGFRAMDEEELLQIIDLAISGRQTQHDGAETNIDLPSILTGIEEQKLPKSIMEDPRASILASAVSGLKSSSDVAVGGSKWSKLPDLVRDALLEGKNQALHNAVGDAVAEKLAALVQTPAEQITAQTKLIDIGMDSMLAVMVRQE